MVDLMQLLEAGTYAAFIAGAIFAVWELREMRQDRRTELLMRTAEFSCTIEFETAAAKFMRSRFKTPEEAEGQVGLPELLMIADYCETLGTLAQRGLVSKDVTLDVFPFAYVWDKIRVWAEASGEIDDPDRDKYGPSYPSFKWLAGEARKRLAAKGI